MLLLISQVDIDYPSIAPLWPLGADVTPWRGYGQWNGYSEFHRALDFHGSVGDLVSAPYHSSLWPSWVLGISPDTIVDVAIEGSVLLGELSSSTYGWHYAHIDVNHPKFTFTLATPINRDIVSVLVPIPELGSHVHFSWLDKNAYAYGGPHPQDGYFNPYEYLSPPPSPRYDEAVFGSLFGPFDYNDDYALSGILFVTDEDTTLYPLLPQDVIRDSVDILVRPYTKYWHDLSNTKCGVREVRWHLLWQDPNTLEYHPNDILGSERTIFDFSGYIPDDNDTTQYYPEYKKIYLLNTGHWINYLCLTNTCDSAREDASFPGVETVWINPYSRQSDYDDDEFCRGVWDTRLSDGYGANPAKIDEAAAFMDGRYAIEVMALPQRSNDTTFITLPVVDITDPESEVTGVIVDNWAPRITDICLKENDWQIIRSGSYEANVLNNPDSGRTLGYNNPGYYFTPYISTGGGTNEYSLEIDFSEPVTDLIQTIPLTIKMFSGPDSSITWQSVIGLQLDESCMTQDDVYMYAIYHGTGDQPLDYVGNQIVELGIESSFATDLAGNGLDADASTIVSAFGSGSSGNYEAVDTLTVVEEYLYGYYRLDSERDSRSNTIWAYYDIIYIPECDEYLYPKHYITLPPSLSDAFLFNEGNYLHSEDRDGSSSCYIYGGAWMYEDDEDILHVYIINYLGNIVHNKIVFDPGTSEMSSEVCATEITTPTYYDENWDETWDLDRYGWLGWKTKVLQEDATFRSEITNDNVWDVELYVTVYDAYTGNSVEHPIGEGDEWWDEEILYETHISLLRGYSYQGGVEVEICEYEYPDTDPVETTLYLDAPDTETFSYRTIDQNNIGRSELSSREVEISDYFNVFPNPASGSVNINFMTSTDVNSTVRIYDISGHLVSTIAEELPGMRNHNLLWNLQDANGHVVPVGIYYVSLVSDSFKKIRTVIAIY
jgi:hypothetical protein